MIASVNLEFPSFAPRHRLSKLISALGLTLVFFLLAKHNQSTLCFYSCFVRQLASVATAEALASLRSGKESIESKESKEATDVDQPILMGKTRGLLQMINWVVYRR